MNAVQSTERRDLWLPAFVGLVGFAISFAGWGLLVADRREQLLSASDEMALETRRAIEAGLENQVDTLRGLQRLWHDFGLRPVDEWRANVGLHVDGLPGLSSVTWVDLDQPDHRITVGREPSGTIFDIPAERARMQAEGAHLEGPERDEAGDFRYRIFIPVQTPEAHAGALVAEFHVAPFLDAVLRARAEGYALSADWNGENVYSLRTPHPRPLAALVAGREDDLAAARR